MSECIIGTQSTDNSAVYVYFGQHQYCRFPMPQLFLINSTYSVHAISKLTALIRGSGALVMNVRHTTQSPITRNRRASTWKLARIDVWVLWPKLLTRTIMKSPNAPEGEGKQRKMENHSLDNLVVGRAIRFHQSRKLWRNKNRYQSGVKANNHDDTSVLWLQRSLDYSHSRALSKLSAKLITTMIAQKVTEARLDPVDFDSDPVPSIPFKWEKASLQWNIHVCLIGNNDFRMTNEC